MTFSTPALQWSILDSTKYRTVDLALDLKLPHSLNQHCISNFNELIAFKSSNLSYSIKTITNVPLWDISSAGVLALGFNPHNQLIVTLQDGKWNVYSDYNGRFKQFKLPIDCQFKNVKFSANGSFMATTQDNEFIHVQSDTKFKIFNQFQGKSIINWWFNEDSSASGNQLTIVQTSEGIHVLDTEEILKFDKEDIMFLDITPNLKFIAIVTNGNKLSILDRQLSSLVTHDILNLQNLNDMKWCGNDALTLAFNDHLEIYGPTPNKFLTIYPPNLNPLISNTNNGIYVLTSSSLQYISKVPESIENVFKLGSTHPSSILLDTLELFERKDPNLNKNLKLINDSMTLAVDTCIRAAAEEFNPFWQRKLLRAASFGKSFLEFYNSNEFVETCSIIQVLNNLRSPEISIFLTFEEFQSLGVDQLINILLLRNFHSLSIEICKKLIHPNFKILTHWAQSKIQMNDDLTDDELLEIITGKLQGKSVSWIEIARFAHVEGRNYLAKKLILNEGDIWSKTKLLIDMNEPQLALAKSCEFFNIDPIIFILLNIKQDLSLIEFYKVLNQSMLSQEVWKVYLSVFFNPKELTDFYYQNEDYTSLILNGVEVPNKLNFQKLISFAKSSTDDDIKMKPILHALEAKLVSIECQSQLLEKYPSIEIGEPIITTIQKLQTLDFSMAISTAKKCKVPNIEFCQIYLDTISINSNDEALVNLLEFSTSTNIGKSLSAEEYYSQLVNLGFKRHASMYIPYFKSDPRFKLKAFIACGLYQEGINLAKDLNDDEVVLALTQLLH